MSKSFLELMTTLIFQDTRNTSGHPSGYRVTFSEGVCESVPASSALMQPAIYTLYDFIKEAATKELLRDMSIGYVLGYRLLCSCSAYRL
jgi:hypothetical protein